MLLLSSTVNEESRTKPPFENWHIFSSAVLTHATLSKINECTFKMEGFGTTSLFLSHSSVSQTDFWKPETLSHMWHMSREPWKLWDQLAIKVGANIAVGHLLGPTSFQKSYLHCMHYYPCKSKVSELILCP